MVRRCHVKINNVITVLWHLLYAKYKKKSVSHITANTLHLRYKERVNAAWGDNKSLLRESYNTQMSRRVTDITSKREINSHHYALSFYGRLVTWCTTILTFNNCTFCPHCIYAFFIYLRTNSDLCHLQHKLIGFYNRDEKCLQRGTDWVFKCYWLRDAPTV